MKLVELYKPEKNKKVRCLACSHKCLISENNIGICRVRKNIKGKLYLLVYGKIIASNPDPIEKKPLYHFLPQTKAFSIGTLGCNFKCDFCQNFDISQPENIQKIINNLKSTTPQQIINQAITTGCKSIAYTYNEPIIFIEYVKDIAILAKKAGLKNILVTNGYFSKESLNYIAPYIDAMNIDLKSFSEKFYQKFCKAKLSPILNNIKTIKKKYPHIHLEITTLLIPKENDSKQELTKIARFIASIDKNIPWHISRFFPMYKMLNKQPTPVETLKQAEKIGKSYLNYVYIGNI